MSREPLLLLLGASFAWSSIQCAPSSTSPPSDAGNEDGPAPRPPNVVFLLTDDLSWDLVQKMPSVQQMQREGLTFTNYFVTDSLCCPSRSSIFTGKYPHDTHVLTNLPPQGGYAVFQQYKNQNETFATALSGAGYETGFLGKYLNGYEPSLNGPDPGWSQWGAAGDAYHEYDYQLNQNGHVVGYGHAAKEYLTDVLSGLAQQFIGDAGSRPFLLEVATFAPHSPYTPAPRYVGTSHGKAPRGPSFATANIDPPRWLAELPALQQRDVEKIDAAWNLRVEAVQAVDDLIRTVRQTLVEKGLSDRTYVVFSSDNGYHMGQHMLSPGKETAFDTDIRVPLIIVGPNVPAGAADAHFVENIDLCPTFAELSGTSVATAEGRSLVPLLRGDTVSGWRNVTLVEHVGTTVEPAKETDPDNELGPHPTSYEAIRTTDALFIRYQDGEIEYYDRAKDPEETRNAAAALSSSEVADLEKTITAIQNCHSAEECGTAQTHVAQPPRLGR